MVFSSVIFLFFFLTLLFLCYFITPKKYRNFILLFFSILFYTCGEPKNVFYLILSCILNYFFGKWIYESSSKKRKRVLLLISFIYNLGQLFYFKYITFFLENLQLLFPDIAIIRVLLPIGISFYTFQAISYVVDIYRGKHAPAEGLVEFATYLTLFSQLVAGPIVRFNDIQEDLKKKTITIPEFSLGIQRFIIGLSKKVLLANALGEYITVLQTETVLASWMKGIAFSLQIYFDFSGYSDMAIGLGLMLGFHFLENFNYPFLAKSVTDFWRRWHISLSSWFRDYIYIPLGGNRCRTFLWLRNIFVVWLLTGLWHGASWNFVLWGLYFAIILIIEKLFLQSFLERKYIRHIYTILVVIISFVIFQNESISQIGIQLQNMFFLRSVPLSDSLTNFYTLDYLGILIFSCIASFPIGKWVYEKLKTYKVVEGIRFVLIFLLFLLCISSLVDASFNPFLYFRF